MKKTAFVAVTIATIILISYFVSIRQGNINTGNIKIGFVIPSTGDAATYGEPIKNAALLAVDEINSSGGINGKKMDAFFEDSKCSGKDALSATKKLIFVDGVKIIGGYTCAEDILSSAQIIEDNHILVVAPGASGPQVSKAGAYIFQTSPSATIATDNLAKLMAHSHKKIAIISEESGFATDINNYFVNRVKSLGGKIVFEGSFKPSTRDFRNIILKIKEADPDGIFINPQTEISGGIIITQIRELGINVPLYGMDTVSGQKTLETAGKYAEGLTIVTVPNLDSDKAKTKDFLTKYEKRFGKPVFDLYLASSYDSVYLISTAIQKVGYDATKIKDYLYTLDNYQGVVGNYRFDNNGDIIGINFITKQVSGGKLKIK